MTRVFVDMTPSTPCCFLCQVFCQPEKASIMTAETFQLAEQRTMWYSVKCFTYSVKNSTVLFSRLPRFCIHVYLSDTTQRCQPPEAKNREIIGVNLLTSIL